MLLARSGEPLTCHWPSDHSRSSAEHSSRCAAIRRALSRTFTHVNCSAVPPTASERDPYVPRPYGDCPVSPWTTSTWSNGMPSSLSTICDHDVSWPCPCAEEPVTTVADP